MSGAPETHPPRNAPGSGSAAEPVGAPRRRLGGWGRYPVFDCVVREAGSADALGRFLAREAGACVIPRGLGRAYGDAALLGSGVVLDQTKRDRLLAFDEESGVLKCEAGVPLASIIDVFLPRGWFVPAMPGTKLVTVGGAIAADVHGKNHHVDGSFGTWVRGLTLLLASGCTMTCSPDHEPDVFWATVGGMGLTGVILTADIQLARTPSAYVSVHFRRTRDLDETLERLQREDGSFRYSVAWVDCLARGPRLGRAVVMQANEARPEALSGRLAREPLLPRSRSRPLLSVPATPPVSLVGHASVRMFNAAYYAAHGTGERLMDYDAFFCPLDRIAHWNRVYGPEGFIQYQALFPPETAHEGLRVLIEKLSSGGAASFLAVLKQTGVASGGTLSFPEQGYTLALDIPRPREGFERLTHTLDDIVLRHGGRVYLAKDATLTPEAFREMYPGLERFLQVKRRVDPTQRFASEQSHRLGITSRERTGAR